MSSECLRGNPHPESDRAMAFVVTFEDDAALSPDRVGQKFATLAKARRNGFAVPEAVAISAEAHRYFVEKQAWPPGLDAEISRAVGLLGLGKGVSIRSSALREDLQHQSFAGQYRTFLAVFNETDLKEKVRQCWLGSDSDRLRSYRQSGSGRKDDGTPLMGVIIQRMVRALVSGVAFSRNPMHPARKEVVIEAVRGLADKLVNGHTTPHRSVLAEDGSITLTPPSGRRRQLREDEHRLLSPDKWREVADMARRLEQLNQRTPQDIEWAMDAGGNVWLLQSRAITTLTEKTHPAVSGIWTRKIANDFWADRLSPFLAAVMENTAPRWNLSRVSQWVGIPVVEPAVAVVNGYLYINCESIKAAIGAVPKSLRLDFLNDLGPPEAGLGDVPAPAVHRTVQRLVRLLFLPLYQPASVPFLTPWLTRRHIRATEGRLQKVAGIAVATTADTFRKLGLTLAELTRIQKRNQWPYFYAAALTWLLRWLLVERLQLSHADFLASVGRGGDNVSLQVERQFRRLAAKILSDETDAESVRRFSPDAILDHLSRPLAKEIEGFIERYGCRSRHRSLYVKRWAEDPAEVLAIIKHLVSGGPPQQPAPRAPAPIRPFPWGMPALIGLTVTFLDLREDLRFLLDRCLFQVRRNLLDLGEKTGMGELVFFLTPTELEGMIESRQPPETYNNLARSRRENFLKPADVATFIVDGRPADEFQAEGQFIRGIGTSPGQVTGCVRVVVDPARAVFQKGDIVVARHTDPGWTPILSIVGGIVMEEGGLLNHCSIVARELGIPSIVGVEHATQRIPDGATVHLDGALGIIRIVAHDQESAVRET